MKSIVDKLTGITSPVIRQLSDLNIKTFLGTETNLLRIVRTEPDVMGEYDEQLESSIINNALVKKPYAPRVQMFQSLDDYNMTTVEGIDLWEILPIDVRVPFKGDYETEEVSLKKGDLLIEILRDENNNKIPFVMQVTRLNGAFHNKHMVGKYYECCLYRGNFPLDVKQKIQEYLDLPDEEI